MFNPTGIDHDECFVQRRQVDQKGILGRVFGTGVVEAFRLLFVLSSEDIVEDPVRTIEECSVADLGALG